MMIDAKNGGTKGEPKDARDVAQNVEGWEFNNPRDLVSPLDFAGGLRAPALSDDELDELCNIEIAALSQPRTTATG